MFSINSPRVPFLRVFAGNSHFFSRSQFSLLAQRCFHQYETPLQFPISHNRYFSKDRVQRFNELHRKIEDAIDRGNNRELAAQLDILTHDESETHSYFIKKMLRKAFASSNPEIFKTLMSIESCTKSLDVIDMMESKTAEQAEWMGSFICKSDLEKTKLLIANAFLREDGQYIQEQLDKKRISLQDFKEIGIPVLYPFQLIIPLSPLLIAINKKSLPLVKILIENGFSYEEELSLPGFEFHLARTPLSIAFEIGADEIVSFLTSCGAIQETKFEIEYHGHNDDSTNLKITYQSEKLNNIDYNKLVRETLNITEPNKKD